MNIEISNEQIERMVNKEVQKVINSWFDTYGVSVIEQCINKAVMSELRDIEYAKITTEAAKEITNKAVVDRVCERISYDIADAYATRYMR